MHTLLFVLGLCHFGILIVVLVAAARFARLPRLATCADEPPVAGWPRLQVLIAARDEADTIEAPLRRLLACDYPRLSVIAVDDRSQDNTGAILDQVASEDERLTVLHIEELPDGWLGKVHALHCAVQHADAEWLLCTDADVHLDNAALKRAIAQAESTHTDHLVVLPEQQGGSVLVRAAIQAFGIGFVLGTDPARMNRSRRGIVGCGAFNLMRREVFARTPGFPWLRLSIIDDVGLGLMLAEHGARGSCLRGADCVSLTWYADTPAMMRGLEKNLFAACRFRWWLALPAATMALTAGALPLISAFLPFPWGLPAWILWSTLALLALMARGRSDPLGIMLLPLGMLVTGMAMLRSMTVTLWRGAVTWRGTSYPLEALRPAQRFTVTTRLDVSDASQRPPGHG